MKESEAQCLLIRTESETLTRDKESLEKRLEKAKEYFNTKRIEDEAKLSEFETLKQAKIAVEKKLGLSIEEAAGLKSEISRLASEILRLSGQFSFRCN